MEPAYEVPETPRPKLGLAESIIGSKHQIAYLTMVYGERIVVDAERDLNHQGRYSARP